MSDDMRDKFEKWVREEANRQYPYYSDEAAYNAFGYTYRTVCERTWQAAIQSLPRVTEAELVGLFSKVYAGNVLPRDAYDAIASKFPQIIKESV